MRARAATLVGLTLALVCACHAGGGAAPSAPPAELGRGPAVHAAAAEMPPAGAGAGAQAGSGSGANLDPAVRARVDAVFAEWDRPDTPGCALGVVQDGALVHARGFGMADLERGVPIGPDSVFDIGSTSKQFTAACIGLLEQDGKLRVGDDVRSLVPELPDYGAPITIDHLLHHTSGLRDYTTLLPLAGVDVADHTTAEDALRILARQGALEFPTGTRYAYSNSGYFLCSQVVERASGRTLAELARERVFEPLGMASTQYYDDHRRIVPRRAIGYDRREGGFALSMSDWEQTGDGAVLTSVRDLARWDANFYDPRVGGPELLAFLRERGKLASGEEIDYARGLVGGRRGTLAYESHGGAWAGYRAQMLRFPELRTTVIVLANLGDIDPSELCWSVAAIVLGLKAPEAGTSRPGATPVAPEADAAIEGPLEDFVGVYECAELAAVYSFELRGDRLTIGLKDRTHLPLQRVERDVFELGGATVRFERDAQGAVTGGVVDAGRVHGLRFRAVRAKGD